MELLLYACRGRAGVDQVLGLHFKSGVCGSCSQDTCKQVVVGFLKFLDGGQNNHRAEIFSGGGGISG